MVKWEIFIVMIKKIIMRNDNDIDNENDNDNDNDNENKQKKIFLNNI